MAFDLGATTLFTTSPFDVVLLVDTDTNFADATVYTGRFIAGGTVTFKNVDFTDGQYFTVAKVATTLFPNAVAEAVQKISGLTGGLEGVLGGSTNDYFGVEIANI